MLYSIGKDSSVMLHLAQGVLSGASRRFPLLHVDTTWKFREMIAFRDRVAAAGRRRAAACTSTRRACARASPITHGATLHTDVMKTAGAEAGAGQVRLRCGLRRRAARRGEVARQGAHLLVPQRAASLGPEEPAPRAVEPLQHPHPQGRERARVPDLLENSTPSSDRSAG